MTTTLRSQRGATLIEVLVSLMVTTVGTLSVATLILYGTRLQTTSRRTTVAMSYARQQVERLRMLPPLSPQRAAGGSLTANVGNHWTMLAVSGPEAAGPNNLLARWVIIAGPAGTKEVTVVVQPGTLANSIVTTTTGTLDYARLGARLWP